MLPLLLRRPFNVHHDKNALKQHVDSFYGTLRVQSRGITMFSTEMIFRDESVPTRLFHFLHWHKISDRSISVLQVNSKIQIWARAWIFIEFYVCFFKFFLRWWSALLLYILHEIKSSGSKIAQSNSDFSEITFPIILNQSTTCICSFSNSHTFAIQPMYF